MRSSTLVRHMALSGMLMMRLLGMTMSAPAAVAACICGELERGESSLPGR